MGIARYIYLKFKLIKAENLLIKISRNDHIELNLKRGVIKCWKTWKLHLLFVCMVCESVAAASSARCCCF